MKVFDNQNMLVVMANIIFFIVVQTLFFRFVATGQFINVMSGKVDILNEYIKYDSNAKSKVKAFVESDQVQEILVKAHIEKKARNAKNTASILKWIGPILLVFTAILIYYVVRVAQTKVWTSTDSVMLSLVAFAYLTELIFYFTIVKQYQFYGDHKIYSTYYDGVINETLKKINIDDDSNDSNNTDSNSNTTSVDTESLISSIEGSMSDIVDKSMSMGGNKVISM